MTEEKLTAERERLAGMHEFENKYAGEYRMICGVDEAGRGPLAGPVVAGAVILRPDCEILYLNDSKKLSPKRRDELYDEIIEKAEAYGIGYADHALIDEINILQATYKAMREAIAGLYSRDTVTRPVPDMLLNDAVVIPDMHIKQVGIVHGDARSVSIAAASILAKVTRDRLMEVMDALYPEYGFAKHKGYGTREHIEAIRRYGACPIHRKTFITKFI